MLLSYVLSLVAALTLLPFAFKRPSDPVRAGIWAASYVVLVSAAAGITAGARFWRLRHQLSSSLTPLLFDLLRIVPWIVPLVVLVARGSIVGTFAVGVFAVVSSNLITRLSAVDIDTARQVWAPRESELLFDFPDSTSSGFHRMRLAALVCVAYVGVLTAMSGNKSVALLCMASAGFFIPWVVRDGRNAERRFEIRIPNLLTSAFLACLVTLVGLSPQGRYLNLGLKMPDPNNARNAAAVDQFHSVVILLTPNHAKIPLVRPHADTPRATKQQTGKRLNSIAFSREYWFSPRPIRRPPASAFREPGDPTSVKVTEEGLPRSPRRFEVTVMQARQDVGQLIDIQCCRWVDVVLRNEELEPATVLMELILVNSTATEHNAQSLGALSLASTAGDSPSVGNASKFSVFRFPLPTNAQIRSFDKMIVWFHLEEPRSRRAASVAIQRFDFIQ